MAADRAVPSSENPLTSAEADALFAPLAGAGGIALAVSGGADSVALMRLVADWRARNGLAMPVTVFTVDHGLRAEARAEAEQAGAWARAVGLNHEILTWHGEKPVADIQAAARAARYRLLVDACARSGLSHLALAHHRDDQAETVLMRLARGSGVDGLAAMAEDTVRDGLTVVRPLLDQPKARLVATLRALGQDWIEDPSNADKRFARPRLRSLMPALAGEGMTAERLADTARRMRRVRAALDQAAGELHEHCVSEDRAGFCRLDRDRFADAPEEIGLRVLSRLLMGIGGGDYPPRLDRLERLYGLLTVPMGEDDSGTIATLAGCRIGARRGALWVSREWGRSGLPVTEIADARPVNWDGRFEVRSDLAISGAKSGEAAYSVRALGRDGLQVLRAGSRLREMPAAVAHVAPAVFRGPKLVAAPLVEAEPGPYSPPGFTFRFLGRTKFANGGMVP